MTANFGSATAWRLLITGAASGLLTIAASVAFGQQPPAPIQPTAGAQEQLYYSPWLKQCFKGQEANARLVCTTSRGSFADSGMALASGVLVEPEGDKKILRITVPEPVALSPGARIVVDQDPPITIPFSTCYRNGCLAEIDASPELIARMKSGQTLFVQAVALTNQVLSLPLPLADFKKVNEGAPADAKAVQDQMKKVQTELQKRTQIAQQKTQPAPR